MIQSKQIANTIVKKQNQFIFKIKNQTNEIVNKRNETNQATTERNSKTKQMETVFNLLFSS